MRPNLPLALLMLVAMSAEGWACAVTCLENCGPPAAPLGMPMLSAAAVLLLAMVSACRLRIGIAQSALLGVAVGWIGIAGSIALNQHLEALTSCGHTLSTRISPVLFVVVSVAAMLLLGLTHSIAAASRYAWARFVR